MAAMNTTKYLAVFFICASITPPIYLYFYQHQKTIQLIHLVPSGSPFLKRAQEAVSTGDENPISNSIDPTHPPLSSTKIRSGISEPDLPAIRSYTFEERVEHFERRLADQQTPGRESSVIRSLRDLFYGKNYSLFEELGLSNEDQGKMLDILLVRTYAHMNLDKQWMDDLPSEDEYMRLYDKIDNMSDMKAEEILEAGDYHKYLQYIEKDRERLEVTRFMDWGNGDKELTQAQKQELILTMKERLDESGFEWSRIGYYSLPSAFNREGNIDRTLGYLDEILDTYRNAAEDILTPSQAGQFEEFLLYERDRTESLLEELDAMYGNQSTYAFNDFD